MYTFTYNYETKLPLICDDGHGDYNRSYDRGYDDFDYADYSTDHRDNNFRNYEKKRRKTNKEIIEDMLKRWGLNYRQKNGTAVRLSFLFKYRNSYIV